MKNYVRPARGLVLVAIMMSLMLPMTFSSSVAANNDSPVSPQPEQQIDLPKQLPPGAYKGEAVRRRINALRATNKALNRAMKDKEKVGKTVNWELSAVLVFPAAKKKEVAKLSLPKMMNASFAPVSNSFAPVQETLSDGTGEATFITYNGPDNTWDGTISVTDYYTGENAVYNGRCGTSEPPMIRLCGMSLMKLITHRTAQTRSNVLRTNTAQWTRCRLRTMRRDLLQQPI